MPEGSHQPQRDAGLKRKAWLAVFAVSALFWIAVGAAAWYFWG
nr:YmiA family putative membrane protein [Atlantibacter sp.]